VNTGNAEQPAAQPRAASHPSAEAPKGPSSPSRVETAVQDRQEPGPNVRQTVQESPERPRSEDQPKGNGSQAQRPAAPQRPSIERPNLQEQKPQEKKAAGPGNGPTAKSAEQDQQNSNGQSKDGREEQPAEARAGTEAGATARGKTGKQSPWTAAYAQHTAVRTSEEAPSAPPPDQPKPGASQQPSNQQRPQPSSGGPANGGPTIESSATAATAPKPDVATSPASAEPSAPIAIPVWDPPPPTQRKQSLFARLGLGKKAAQAEAESEVGQPEDHSVTPPATQAPAASTSAAPRPPAGAGASTGATAAMGTAAPQVGTPAQSKPAQSEPAESKPAESKPAQSKPAQPKPAPPKPAQPAAAQPTPAEPKPEGQAPRPTAPGHVVGAAAAAGLSAAGPTQVRPQPPGQPSIPPQGRVQDNTGRTPPAQGDAGPGSAPQARMQAAPVDPAARMPSATMRPGAAGPIPMPAPVQAFKEANTSTGQSVPVQTAVTHPPGAVAPDHHLAKPKVGVARRTRKARLRLSRLDPWSVMKTSFLFSIAAGIMLVVAVYSIWAVLSTSHLFDSINEIVRSVVSTPGDTTPFRIQEYINTQKVMGVSALIACVDVVIFTALATLGSFLYNLAATMLGGLEITLAED